MNTLVRYLVSYTGNDCGICAEEHTGDLDSLGGLVTFIEERGGHGVQAVACPVSEFGGYHEMVYVDGAFCQ